MKNSRQQTPYHNTKLNSNKHRPENKDDIDSRSNEEQDTKGTDVTHNKKEHQNDRKNVKND